MGILDMVSGNLPATRGHAVRAWYWVPGAAGDPDGVAGELTLAVQQSAKPGAVVNRETYKVLEDCSVEFPARSWLLCKTSDGEIHETRLDQAGWRCSCDGFKFTGHCKHSDSLKILKEEGLLDLEPAIPAGEWDAAFPPQQPSRAEMDQMAVDLGWMPPRAVRPGEAECF